MSAEREALARTRGAPGQDDSELLTFYRRYGGIVFARCRSLLGNDTAAQDATQETFLRVHRHFARKLPGPDNALAWLYRIATNHCLNQIRGERIRPALVAEIPEQGGEDWRERLADRDLAERVVRAAPAPLRTVAWLFHVDGMEQDEIAQIMGCARRTIATRLSRFADFGRKFCRRGGA